MALFCTEIALNKPTIPEFDRTNDTGFSLSEVSCSPAFRVLATDIDGTLAPEKSSLHRFPYDNSLPVLEQVVQEMEMAVWYVTARDLHGVRTVMAEFDLVLPNEYIATHVGTKIYKAIDNGMDGRFEAVSDYHEWIESQTPNWNIPRFKEELSDLLRSGLIVMQDLRWQNEFKLSFYTPDFKNFNDIENLGTIILSRLKNICPFIQCISSQDPRENYGLLDVVPSCADKAGAIEYMRQQLKILSHQIFVAGDNMNDESALKAGYGLSIMPNNAHPRLRHSLIDHARSSDKRIIAASPGLFNANYSSGILEGLMEANIIEPEQVLKIKANR